MNKLIIPIIVILIIAAGIGAYFIFQKPTIPETKADIPYYFIAIHNEPYHVPDGEKKLAEEFNTLKRMIAKADQYNIKLTLMFTPQWADYISESPERMADLESWKKQGHEIAAHHHSIYHGNWDGYTNYPEEEALAERQKQTKNPEEYLGTLNDYIKKLRKLNPNIKSCCCNEEHDKKEMPDEIIYATCSSFANCGEVGTRLSDTDEKKGKNEYILTGTANNILRKWLTHCQITNSELQKSAQTAFDSINPSHVYGVVTHSASGVQEEEYYNFLEFLHSRDPEGKKSRTSSEIIEQKLLPEETISTDLLNQMTPSIVKPQQPAGKCGDGVCDSAEKANSDLCPKDCQTPIVSSEDSPFGIFGPYEWKLDSPDIASVNDINNYLKDLGIKWIQEMYFTEELKDVPGGINIYSRVGKEGDNKPPQTSSEKYKEELRKVIQQYKDKIKYWEVGTEPSGFPPPNGWQGYAEEYANHLKITYEIIKQECPNCYVIFGGMPGVGTDFSETVPHAKHTQFLRDVLQAGGGKYFDVFEFKQHAANANDYQELKNRMEVFGKILADYGIDIKKIPVFVETATHDGSPSLPTPGVKLSSQTEAQQSAGLLKYYVFGLAHGIDKIFWNLIIERHNFSGKPENPFNFYGLVNNPDNDDKSHKKLAYYTYKKMVEVLEGSDWNNIQKIQESDGIYIYKFIKNKSIWVAWNDNSEEKQITIFNITSSQVKITEAIPKYESGKEVTDYNTAFGTETKTVQNNKISITLGDVPMFVEGK